LNFRSKIKKVVCGLMYNMALPEAVFDGAIANC
jgi:hypothetical protein